MRTPGRQLHQESRWNCLNSDILLLTSIYTIRNALIEECCRLINLFVNEINTSIRWLHHTHLGNGLIQTGFLFSWNVRNYRQIPNISRTKSQTDMFLILSCSSHRQIHWSHVLSREWRCSWSSADRRCSNYIWMINNFGAYQGAPYFWGLTVFRHEISNWQIELAHHNPVLTLQYRGDGLASINSGNIYCGYKLL